MFSFVSQWQPEVADDIISGYFVLNVYTDEQWYPQYFFF